jgi:hypothetical protein
MISTPKKTLKCHISTIFKICQAPKKPPTLSDVTPRRHQETWRLRNELAQQQQQGTCQARQDHAHVPIVVQQGEEAREETSAVSKNGYGMWDMKTTQKI